MKDTIVTTKKVGQEPNIGIFEDEDGIVGVVAGKPDFVIHPISKKRINILEIYRTDRETICPGCGKVNKPGVIMRILEGGLIVYECGMCKKYHFCEIRE